MTYRIVWSSKYGQGEKIVEGAAMAHAWVCEFEDKGADAIKVTRDGVLIDVNDLSKLILEEAAAHGRTS